MAHYKFYYNGVLDGREEPILLDVLFEKNPYPQTREIKIAHPWLSPDGEALTVTVPTYESILGDKLTAFAPKTTGILYSKGRPVEIIKQLFGIAFLYDRATDFQVTKKSFIEIAQEEIGHRNLAVGWEDVLDDTYQACLELVMRNEQSTDYQQLVLGLRNITNFIIQNFRIDEAVIAAGKVAFLTAYLKTNLQDEVPRYVGNRETAPLEIQSVTYSRVQRLKRTNPEAFFYWYHALTSRGI